MKAEFKPLRNQVNEIKEELGAGSINFFGRPGAGKDTQAARLAFVLDAGKQLGGGDILRNSEIPDRVKKIMETGALIPTPDYVEIVLPYLSSTERAGRALVLSAVGRMNGEQQGVIEALKLARHELRIVPYLDITDEEFYSRLNKAAESGEDRGRVDDRPEARQKRLDDFMNQTLPVVDWYEKEGLLLRVNAMQSKEDVYTSLVHGVHDRLTGRG
jgi:adenylate kinase